MQKFSQEQLVLVDHEDNPIGVSEKLSAHLEGKLHRAISVFIFNARGELMLQQRAFSKYHSGGLWSNTCCGHPRPGEAPIDAAKRRLFEEMGIQVELQKSFNFTYRAVLDKQIIEHEFDHVFTGRYELEPFLNAEEANDWKWIDRASLLEDIERNPQNYTYWFKLVVERVFQQISLDLPQFARPAQLCAEGGVIIPSEKTN